MSNSMSDKGVLPPALDGNLFRPTKRDGFLLAALGLASFGLAVYLRDSIVQNRVLGFACEAGEQSLTCNVRLVVVFLFTWSVFGSMATAAAILQFLRPHFALFAIALISAMLGLMLYNTWLAALAVTMLVLSLGRAAPAGR
jgi:hypothetical protein